MPPADILTKQDKAFIEVNKHIKNLMDRLRECTSEEKDILQDEILSINSYMQSYAVPDGFYERIVKAGKNE